MDNINHDCLQIKFTKCWIKSCAYGRNLSERVSVLCASANGMEWKDNTRQLQERQKEYKKRVAELIHRSIEKKSALKDLQNVRDCETEQSK